MKRISIVTGVLSVVTIIDICPAYGRGFGGGHMGGGFGGGGFHGGMGGGLPGGLGAGGFGGGMGAGGLRGELGGGGLGPGSPGGGGLSGAFGGGGRLPGGLGQRFGPGAGGLGPGGLGAGGFGADRLQGRAGQLGGLGGGLSGAPPTASRLSSFLGLPTDGGLSAAGGADVGARVSGSARGLSPFEASGAGSAGASGHVWEGPHGTTIAHGSAGERGGIVGPDGGAAGERGASGTVIKGPDGGVYAHGSAGERGVVAGPGGIAAGGREASGTVVKGPGGNVVAHGQASSRGFYAGATGAGTWHCSAADMRVQGNYVRADFHHWDAFGRDWYRRYPAAWYARGFAAGVWTAATWASLNAWFDADWPAVGYYYGDNITYGEDNVYLDGEPIATTSEYYQSAADLAQTGEQANVDDSAGDQADPQWLPLGVFEAVPGDKKSSEMTFQLAVNKAGVIRGNYYNTGDNNVQQVQGAVDKQTQRATWVVVDRKNVVFDTGLYNLTKDESTVLVHESADKTEQWTLVRLKQPSDSAQTTN